MLYVESADTADPDFVTSTYNPAIPFTEPGRYTIRARATAGKITKELYYGFDVINITGGNVEAGGESSFNQFINFTSSGSTNPYDTNKDNVISWDEIKEVTGDPTFNDFFTRLNNDLTGGSYHYTFGGKHLYYIFQHATNGNQQYR
ncbi:hypothetical protein [Cohnella sp.]|uniref:hypothetical protein n=1 Tax=Cohnella sp. TaxID=1883426 RepID=UPI0035659EBB